MKNNDFEIFDNAGDDMIEKIAEDYPVLTDEEKERMFAMSERKFNIAESKGEAEVVSGVERYKKPAWHRYAAMAAALVLVFGGIGGTFFLGRRMVKSAPEKTPAAQTEETAPGTTNEPASDAAIVTGDTSSEATTQPVTQDSAVTVPGEDRDAIAAQLVENYRTFSEFFLFGSGFEMSNDPIGIRTAYNDNQDSFMSYAVKITDPSVQSEDDLRAIAEATWTSGMADRIMRDTFAGDLTEKIENGLIQAGDLKTFFIYNGDLYFTSYGMDKGIGETVSVTTEGESENDFLIHWKYIAHGMEVNKTLHASKDIGVWRVADCVNGTFYTGSPSTQELHDAATELFRGYADVFNRMHGAGVEIDLEDEIVFTLQNYDPSNDDGAGEEHATWEKTYARITTPEIASGDAINSYFSKFRGENIYGLSGILNDISAYSDDTVYTQFIVGENTGLVSASLLTRFIVKDGRAYAEVTDKDGADIMHRDPEIKGIYELGPNDAFIVTDDETAMAEGQLETVPNEQYGYYITREDTGVWQISSLAPASGATVRY